MSYLSSYQFAICTDRRVLSSCFETAHLVDFISVETSTSGDVETFTFWLSPRGTRVKRTQLSNVASGHAPIIKFLHSYLRFSSCAGLQYPSLIKTMCPLHALGRQICIYIYIVVFLVEISTVRN